MKTYIKAGFKNNQTWTHAEYFQCTALQVIDIFKQQQIERLAKEIKLAEQNLQTVEETYIPEKHDYYNQLFFSKLDSLMIDYRDFENCMSYEELVKLPNMHNFYMQEILVNILTN